MDNIRLYFEERFGNLDNRIGFNTLDEFYNKLHEYGKVVGCAFRIQKTYPPAAQGPPKYRVFVCVRAGRTFQPTQGIRRKSSVVCGCRFSVTARLRDEVFIATHVKLEHNHTLDPVGILYTPQYRRLSQGEMATVVRMVNHDASTLSVCNFVRGEFGKPMDSQGVRNIRSK